MYSRSTSSTASSNVGFLKGTVDSSLLASPYNVGSSLSSLAWPPYRLATTMWLTVMVLNMSNLIAGGLGHLVR